MTREKAEKLEQLALEQESENNEMKRKEAAGVIKFEKACVLRQDTPQCHRDCKKCDLLLPTEDVLTAYDMAIKALEQEPIGDLISRQDAIKAIDEKAKRIKNADTLNGLAGAVGILFDLPPVKPQEPKTGCCKECKYFEYDSVAKVDGIPLIVAHEICKRWGDGCKTRENGYCFLFEPQESEG